MKKAIVFILAAAMIAAVSLCGTLSYAESGDYVVDLADAEVYGMAQHGAPAQGYDDDVVLMPINSIVGCGKINLANYKKVIVEYSTDCDFEAYCDATDITCGFGLKSGYASFGYYFSESNKMDWFDVATLGKFTEITDGNGDDSWADGERTMEISLDGVDYSGNVYLSNYTYENNDIVIVSITFVNNNTPDPTPSEAPSEAPEATEASTEVPTEAPDETEVPTEAPTEEPAATEAPTGAPTEEPAATRAPEEKSGCGSIISGGFAAAAVMAAAAMLRKKEN